MEDRIEGYLPNQSVKLYLYNNGGGIPGSTTRDVRISMHKMAMNDTLTQWHEWSELLTKTNYIYLSDIISLSDSSTDRADEIIIEYPFDLSTFSLNPGFYAFCIHKDGDDYSRRYLYPGQTAFFIVKSPNSQPGNPLPDTDIAFVHPSFMIGAHCGHAWYPTQIQTRFSPTETNLRFPLTRRNHKGDVHEAPAVGHFPVETMEALKAMNVEFDIITDYDLHRDGIEIIKCACRNSSHIANISCDQLDDDNYLNNLAISDPTTYDAVLQEIESLLNDSNFGSLCTETLDLASTRYKILITTKNEYNTLETMLAYKAFLNRGGSEWSFRDQDENKQGGVFHNAATEFGFMRVRYDSQNDMLYRMSTHECTVCMTPTPGAPVIHPRRCDELNEEDPNNPWITNYTDPTFYLNFRQLPSDGGCLTCRKLLEEPFLVGPQYFDFTTLIDQQTRYLSLTDPFNPFPLPPNFDQGYGMRPVLSWLSMGAEHEAIQPNGSPSQFYVAMNVKGQALDKFGPFAVVGKTNNHTNAFSPYYSDVLNEQIRSNYTIPSDQSKNEWLYRGINIEDHDRWLIKGKHLILRDHDGDMGNCLPTPSPYYSNIASQYFIGDPQQPGLKVMPPNMNPAVFNFLPDTSGNLTPATVYGSWSNAFLKYMHNVSRYADQIEGLEPGQFHVDVERPIQLLGISEYIENQGLTGSDPGKYIISFGGVALSTELDWLAKKKLDYLENDPFENPYKEYELLIMFKNTFNHLYETVLEKEYRNQTAGFNDRWTEVPAGSDPTGTLYNFDLRSASQNEKQILLENTNTDKSALLRIKLNYDIDRDGQSGLPGNVDSQKTWKYEYFIIKPKPTGSSDRSVKRIFLPMYLEENFKTSYPEPVVPIEAPELITHEGNYYVEVFDDSSQYAIPGDVIVNIDSSGQHVPTPTPTPVIFEDSSAPKLVWCAPVIDEVTKFFSKIEIIIADDQSPLDRTSVDLIVTPSKNPQVLGTKFETYFLNDQVVKITIPIARPDLLEYGMQFSCHWEAEDTAINPNAGLGDYTFQTYDNHPPMILSAGYGYTNITQSAGGEFDIWVIIFNDDDPPDEEVSLFYDEQKLSTLLGEFVEIGEVFDGANDIYYRMYRFQKNGRSITILPGHVPAPWRQFQIQATEDSSDNSGSMWPYINVGNEYLATIDPSTLPVHEVITQLLTQANLSASVNTTDPPYILCGGWGLSALHPEVGGILTMYAAVDGTILGSPVDRLDLIGTHNYQPFAQLYDDGTNGDEEADDNIFTLEVPLIYHLNEGDWSLAMQATAENGEQSIIWPFVPFFY